LGPEWHNYIAYKEYHIMWMLVSFYLIYTSESIL